MLTLLFDSFISELVSDQPLSDVVALTAEYCAAVGAYPASAPLAVEEVVYLTEVRFTLQ